MGSVKVDTQDKCEGFRKSSAPGYAKPAIFWAFTSYRLKTLTGNSFLMCNKSKQFILNATFFLFFFLLYPAGRRRSPPGPPPGLDIRRATIITGLWSVNRNKTKPSQQLHHNFRAPVRSALTLGNLLTAVINHSSN